MSEGQALTFGGHGLVEGEIVRCADFDRLRNADVPQSAKRRKQRQRREYSVDNREL